jgi:hypothetical protein
LHKRPQRSPLIRPESNLCRLLCKSFFISF